jgi:hypothetical protein
MLVVCYSCFIIIRQNFFPVSFSSRISYAGFPTADIFVIQMGIYVQDGFQENKREWMDFLL